MNQVVLFLWLALQGVSSEGARHMQAGVDAQKQGHLDVAVAEFRKATETDPNFAQAFLDLGEVYSQMRDFSAAIPAFKRALELNPELDAAHLQLGYALLSQGYAAEAIPHLQRVNAVEALGIAQIEAGQYKEAVSSLSAALAKHPNNQDLLYYLGRASGLLSKGAVDSLMSGYPDSARAHQAMGENYLVLRQMPQAEKEFSEALRQRPEIPGLHLDLGLVYAGAAQWDKAAQQFQEETKLRPGDPEASFRLGAALLQLGKAHDAKEELARANALKPDMPETLYSLGKAASLEGDSALAEKSWSRLIELEKETPLAAQAHFGLATLYRKQGKADQARREMQEFQRLQKAAPSTAAPN